MQRSSAQYASVFLMNELVLFSTILRVPTDIVLLVVVWRLRSKLSLRDVAEMFLERGFVFTRETVRTGKLGLRLWWQTNCAQNGVDKPGDPGMWMRRT
jgi:uncharacterized membrane protein